MSSELFPLVSGVLTGLVIGLIRPSLRRWAGILLAVVLGTLATIVSGEFAIGWEFLLIDIPLVGGTATATLWATQIWRRRMANED